MAFGAMMEPPKQAFARGYGECVEEDEILREFNPNLYSTQKGEAPKLAPYKRELLDMWADRTEMLRTQLEGKATYSITSGDLGTLPIYVDSRVENLSLKDTIVTGMLRRRAHPYQTVDFTAWTATGGANFLPEGATGLTDDDPTQASQRVDMKYLYTQGNISGVAEAVMAGFADNRVADMMAIRVQAMNEQLEQTILTGDGSGNTFKGFGSLFTANQTPASSVKLSMDLWRDNYKQIVNNGGKPIMAITDFYTLEQARGLIDDVQRNQFGGVQGFGGAWISGVMIDNIMILGSRFMPTTAGTRKLFTISPEYLELRNLLPLTADPLGKVLDYNKWLLREYVTLADMSANNVGTPGDGTGGKYHGQITALGDD